MQLLKKLFLLLFLFACITANGQKRSANLEIHFASGKTELNKAAIMRLDSLADSLHQALKYEVKISGHADSRGDSLKNIQLAQQRTDAVKEFLEQKGIVVKSTASHGDRRPQSDNNSENGQAQNRRVEIAVRYIPKHLPPNPLPLAPNPYSTTMTDLYALLQDPPQEFCISALRDTIVRCKDGTVICLKANAFKLSPPCSQECMTLKVKEVFDKSSMITENLSTTSNGRILESQGMVYTELLDCQGRKIDLLPGKSIVVSIPSDQSALGFQMFDGVRQGPKERMNWVKDPASSLSSTPLKKLINCSDQIDRFNRCQFFFCKIKRFVNNLFTAKRFKRPNQTVTRFALPRKSGSTRISNESCAKLQELCEKYGIMDKRGFLNMLNAQLLDTLGYKSADEMFAKMDAAELDAMMMQFQNTWIAREQYNLNIFNSTRTGWKNCDKFINLPPEQIVDMKIAVQDGPTIDCKLMMRRQKILLNGEGYDDSIYFRGIKRNQPATLVALKYEEGKAYLAVREIETDFQTFDLEFKEYGIPELKAELRKLDFVANM